MDIKKLKQILTSLADSTRLRILNILGEDELTVSDICETLHISQPTVSKHLMRLRLLRIVYDRREGNFIYYSINVNSEQGKIVRFLLEEFSETNTFIRDRKRRSHVIDT